MSVFSPAKERSTGDLVSPLIKAFRSGEQGVKS